MTLFRSEPVFFPFFSFLFLRTPYGSLNSAASVLHVRLTVVVIRTVIRYCTIDHHTHTCTHVHLQSGNNNVMLTPLLQDGMKIGIGSGSTVVFAVERIGQFAMWAVLEDWHHL